MGKYTVARDFTDAQGKQWKAGQPYTGSDDQARQNQGNLKQAQQGQQKEQPAPEPGDVGYPETAPEGTGQPTTSEQPKE